MKDIPPNVTQDAEPKPPFPRMAYSLKETAEVLGISYISVFRLVQRGFLKSSKALRHRMIAATEIQRFLNETAR